jgi:drug/metabolite transporter (DMT)-like permease
LSSFTSAIALIGLHRLKELDPRSIVVHFSVVSLLFCIVAAVVFPLGKQGALPVLPLELGPLTAIGITATVGQLMLTKAFSTGAPAQVSVVNLTQIAYAALIEGIFLGRSFSTVTLLGMALVLSPTAWVLLQQRGRVLPVKETPAQ